MRKMNTFKMVEQLVAQSTRGQKKRPGDYVDQDGLLVCGTCGQRRQARKEFSNPVVGDPERKTTLVVPVVCRCDIEDMEREKREEQEQKERSLVRQLRSASLMDERLKTATFGNFVETPENSKLLRLCKRYATGFDEMMAKNQGMLLWGGVGSGKTFAAACIANYLLDKGVPVVMTSMIALLSAIEAERGGEQWVLSRLNAAKLLIIDDLGTERSTSYAIEKVYSIVDSRYRAMRPVIMTTNLPLEKLKEEQDIRYARIYDRILETCYDYHCTGGNWRKQGSRDRREEMRKLLEVE